MIYFTVKLKHANWGKTKKVIEDYGTRYQQMECLQTPTNHEEY